MRSSREPERSKAPARSQRRTHLLLLGRNARYRYLWSSRTVSLFGDAIARVALILYVYQLDASRVALLLVAQTLPRLFGPLAGALADRTDHRRLMMTCELGQAILIGTVALLLPPFPVIFVLVMGASVLSTLFMPAGRSTVPLLVASDSLPAANALLGSALNLSIAAGPAVGGVLAGAIGVRGTLGLDALSFVVSAALLSRLPPLRPGQGDDTALRDEGEEGSSGGGDEAGREPDRSEARAVHRIPEGPTGIVSSTWDGVRYTAAHPVARAVALGLFTLVLFASLDNVALVFLAKDVFRVGDAEYGLLAALYGIGMIVAPLGALGIIGEDRSFGPRSILLLGIALTGAGLLLTGLAPAYPVALLTFACAGAGNGLENVANDTLVQRSVPQPMLGRVFGTAYTGAFLASSIAYPVGGLLVQVISPRQVFVIAGVGVSVSLFVVWLLLPRGRHKRRPHRIST